MNEIPSDLGAEKERIELLLWKLRSQEEAVRRAAAKELNTLKLDAKKLGDAIIPIRQSLFEALQIPDEEARGVVASKISVLNDWPAKMARFLETATGRIGEAVALDRSLPFMPLRDAVEEDWEGSGRELAVRFMPHVDGRGMELWSDTRVLFLGMQCRALRDPREEDRRCIQYVYLWSMQRRPISVFYSSMFFLMLAALVAINGQSTLFSTWTWRSILLVGLGLCFAAYGAFRYFRPVRCFKNHVWYSVGGMFLVSSEWEQVVLKNPVPFSLWILTVGGIVLFVASMALRSRLLEHIMDYGPIFIYLKRERSVKTERSIDWIIEKVYYDKHHYSLAVTREGGELDRCRKGDTVFLRIDNLWHSFELDESHSHKEPVLLWVRCQVALCLLSFVLPLALLPVVNAFPRYLNISLFVGIGSTAFLAFLNWFMRIPILPLRPDLKLTDAGELSKLRLSKEKLVHLWNMSREEARFKIRMKLQEPFTRDGDPDYWKDFYDPPPTELVYQTFREIAELRRAIGKTAQEA